MPILKSAQEAVLNIEKSQLQIIKSYNNPPPLVVKVLNACCLLFGYEENWENAKRYLLNDIRFLNKLLEFNVNTAPDSRFVKLRTQYLKDDVNFNKKIVSNQSEAAASIFQWLTAINVY